MDKIELRKILESKYDRISWIKVLKAVFSKGELVSNPVDLELNEDIAKSGYELGSFYTSDKRIITVYEVKLHNRIKIEKNRVTIRNLLKKFIKQTDGAFIVFEKGDKWRFTYVSELRKQDDNGKWVEISTEPKRYTYVLGRGETVKTAEIRFSKLLQNSSLSISDIFEAFSVEKLNTEFFEKYRDFYKQFWTYLASVPRYRKLLEDKKVINEDKKLKPIRDFIKILLGRIVFLHFLQKKRWLGVPIGENGWKNGNLKFMQELFENSKDKDHFHSKVLRSLFFKTLNRKRDNYIAPGILGNGIKIPYLNGGLFEEDISCKYDLDFPFEYFKNLLEFFEQYNFTIDENSPEEMEVGIDPEMLGHIFENLLEENREKGVFYTPKEIVQYMCQESLIQYLYTHLGNNETIDGFIRRGFIEDKTVQNNFIVKNARKIEELLDNVKVCDPAIGSGAFPMGILQEILKAKSNLDLTLDRAEAKRHILQNSIYGVDLESGAVDIARLRFWLALVVDEDEPTPLPNLDFKIMQGNSLLERFEGIDLNNVLYIHKTVKLIEPEKDLFGKIKDPQISITDYRVIEENDLQQLTEDFFDEVDPSKKLEIREIINKVVHEHIDYNMELRLLSLTRQISEAKQRDKNSASDKVHARLIELVNEKDELKESRKILHALQNTTNKPYFLWHLFFSKVFEKGGFDIVIGNPPYRQIQKMGKEGKDLERGGFETFSLTGDVYCLFYELGKNLVKPKGTLIYITSNKWMNAEYGKKLRRFFIKETNPILLIDFSKTVIFPAAVVFVNILELKRQSYNNELKGVKAQSDYQIHFTNLANYVREKSVHLSDLTIDSWSVADKFDMEISKQIDKIGRPLKQWDVNFFAGIKTSFNEAFHIPRKTKDLLIKKDPNSAQIIKPLLRGKDIKRWSYDFKDIYLINSHNGVRNHDIPRINVVNDYPAIYEYLMQYYDKNSPLAMMNDDGTIATLKDRQDQGDHWTNLRNCAFIEEFEKEKIIWMEISDRANYCLDTKGHYLTNSAYFLTGNHLQYLLGVMNSKLMDFYFFQKTAQIAGGRKRYTKQYVELLPIPRIPTEKMLPFEIIVEYLTYLNNNTNPPVNVYVDNISISPVFEEVLNMMVFELYFGEHMKNNEIDVLQYCNFESINRNENKLSTTDTISKEYSKLQEQSNPIRNRIIQANIKSKDIIRRINSTIN